MPFEHRGVIEIERAMRDFQIDQNGLYLFVNISEKKIEQIIQTVRHQFKADVVQAIEDNGRIVTDLLRQEIKASAQGVKTELRQEMQAMKLELRQEMRVMKEDIIDVLDNGVLPQIDGLDRRVTRLERLAKI